MPDPIPNSDILNTIRNLSSMADLEPERFSEEYGLADSFIRNVGKSLKPTQLRRIFHQIKELKRQFKLENQYDRNRLALIMPTFAYALGRNLIPRDFYDLMKLCFGTQKCKTLADFERAADFLEAIMAYHKYHEKDGSEK